MIVLQGAREPVEAIDFSPDGRTLVAPYTDGVQVWDDLTTSGSPAAVLDHRYIESVRFTPDGSKLLLGGSRGGVVLHDLPTGEAVEVTPELSDPATGESDLTPDGRYVVTVVIPVRDERSVLSCWPVADPASPAWSVTTPRLVFSPPLFLAGGSRFVVFEWWYESPGYVARQVNVTRDAWDGEVVAEVPVAGEEFHSPVISQDRRLIAARQRARVAVFRAEDMGAEPVKLRNDTRHEFTGLAFHPSGRFLAVTSNDQMVKLYDTATWAVAQAYTWGIGRLRSVAFSPDGMLAAAGGDTGKVVVWDVDH